jgi:RNA polymerase sigma-70 factor (ECF subfamily)
MIQAAAHRRTAAFLHHLPEGRREEAPELEQLLGEMVAEAHGALEGLEIEEDWLLARFASRLPEGPITAALKRLRPADLALASLCAEGDQRAIAWATARYREPLRRALSQKGFDDVADDVLQQAMERAFVGPDPDIVSYAGRGSLGRWLQTLALRTALNQRRGHRRELLYDDDRLFERATDHDDPEVENLKRLYRGEFKRAFQRAFACLDTRQRNLLRYLYLDHLNIDDVGRIYGVHRATVARWRTQARDRLNRETRRIFASEHRLSAKELDSIVHLIESQMEVSLSRILAEDGGPAS